MTSRTEPALVDHVSEPTMSTTSDSRSAVGFGPPPDRPTPGLGHRRRRRRHRLLQLRGRVSLVQFLAIAALVFVGLLAAWQLVTAADLVDPLFLPEPIAVWDRLRLLSGEGTLWDDIAVSTYRIVVGFVLATVIAVPLGILMGVYRVWEAALEPIVDFIRYMPVVAFVPLSIIWVGTDDTQKFLIIFIGTFFQQVLMIMDNTKRIPQDFIDVGRTLGMPDRRILRRIVAPSAAPGIWDSMRITLGWAWTYLTLAELVAASSGLGYRITVGQRFFQTDLIIGYIIVLGILGLVTDQLMKLVGRRLFAWAEASR
jgi:NitT/TauT family transport system permease protein